jgi:hypothetical protein
MNEIAEYKHIYKQCHKLNHELARIIVDLNRMRAQKIGILLGLPGAAFTILRCSRTSLNIIDEIKAAFLRCRCDGNRDIRGLSVQIGEKMLDLATEARDHYCNLNGSASRIPIIQVLLCKSIQDTLIDWDDLVTDLVLWSDIECRDILSKICRNA